MYLSLIGSTSHVLIMPNITTKEFIAEMGGKGM